MDEVSLVHIFQKQASRFIASGILLFSLSVSAEKLDLRIQNELIEKLSSVVDQGTDPSEMIQQKSLVLRLADLHSERARALTLIEGADDSAETQSKIKNDRRRALELYQKVLKSLEPSEEGRVRLQMSHLHLLMGEKGSAEIHLKKLASDRRASLNLYRAQALIQLGEFEFEKTQFAKAKSFFEQALRINENPQKAYTISRLSWCVLNLGDSQGAERRLTSLLKQPELFQNSRGEKDEAFLAETSKDLATFMAQNDVTRSKIELLRDLSPQSVRQSNLIHLATELDRTSKKKSAVLVWSYVDQKAITIQERVQKQIHLARIQYDLGDKPALVREIKESLKMLMSNECVKAEDCLSQMQDLRRVITDWGKAEERKPSTELVRAYVEFLKHNDDFEMAYWAAQAATQRNEHLNAFKLYQVASKSEGLRQALKESKDPRYVRIFEGSLLASVESAERVGDKKLLKEAYFHYLSLAPEGEKSWEVRYQVARLYYEENNLSEALPRFREIALNTAAPVNLRKKSADLFFDSLALKKEDQQIEKEALIFQKAFPADRESFNSLWRKSVLKQSAQVLKDTQSNSGELNQQMLKLNAAAIQTWPLSERKQAQKNKLLLAYRLKDLVAVEKSINLYLQNNLSLAERREALETLAWAQEMRFEFSRALSTLQKMTPPSNPKQRAAHFFKMGLLADLAKQRSSPFFEKALQSGLRGAPARFAAAQLIQKKSNPTLADLRKRESLLRQDPQLFAQSALAVWERSSSLGKQELERRLRQPQFSSTPQASLLRTSAALKDFKKVSNSIYLSLGKSESMQQRQLKKRIEALAGLERWTQKGVKSGDLTLQFVGLAELSKGYSALVEDVKKLPVPRGLKKDEVANYQKQVAAQLRPYQEKSAQMANKARDLFRNQLEKEFLKDLTLWSQTPSRAGAKLAKQELLVLEKSVGKLEGSPRVFVRMTEESRQLFADSQEALQAAQRDPFEINKLQKLRDSKLALQDGPWVAYLSSRISEMALKQNVRGEVQ